MLEARGGIEPPINVANPLWVDSPTTAGSSRTGRGELRTHSSTCAQSKSSSTALARLWRTPGEIRIEVSEEGRGIHQEIQSKIASGKSAGVGLRGMRERVKQFDGTLEIHSNGKGASIWSRYRSPRKPFRPTRATRTAPQTSVGEAKPCDYEITSGTTYVPALKIVA
jgi:hypothetical protein